MDPLVGRTGPVQVGQAVVHILSAHKEIIPVSTWKKGSYKNKGSCWQGSGANPEADNWLDSTG